MSTPQLTASQEHDQDITPNVPSPQELAMLRDLRVELNRKKGFDENHLLLYKGSQYNPDQERQVLGTGAGIIGLVAIGTCALATVQFTKVSGAGGALLRMRNWWVSTPIGRMMDGREARRHFERQQQYENLRRRGLSRVVDAPQQHEQQQIMKQEQQQLKQQMTKEQQQQQQQATSTTTSETSHSIKQQTTTTTTTTPETSPTTTTTTTPPLQDATLDATGTKPRILVQKQLPQQSTPPGAADPMPLPPNSIQPAQPAQVAPDWAKFQRKEGKTVNPSLQKAYDYKSKKAGEEPNAMKKWKLGFNYSKLTTEQKTFGSKNARRSFLIGSAVTTAVVGGVGYAILSAMFGITSYGQYKDWMSSDENQFKSEVLKRYTNQWTVSLSTWLRSSWFNTLLLHMREHVFDKHTEETEEDHAIGDYFQAYASSWVGYQIDLISLFSFKPSRANNPSVDEILELYQQPAPNTREEYEQEQLRILRQLAGIPEPPRQTVMEVARPLDQTIELSANDTPQKQTNTRVQMDAVIQDHVAKQGV